MYFGRAEAEPSTVQSLGYVATLVAGSDEALSFAGKVLCESAL
jgi:hypothetical protein